MSRNVPTRTVGDQITTLLTRFALTTAARELVSRFVHAEQQPALPLLLDVLQLEAQERHERRITRLRRASKLPPGKTFETLDEGRLPPALVPRLHELADGDFLDDATNSINRATQGHTAPTYLSSDHDPLYRFHQWQANLRILDVKAIKTVPYAPLSPPFFERLTGTIRPECLD